jgi:hypothetical protein
MGSGAMIHIQSFIKIGSGIQKLKGDTKTHTQHGSHKPTFSFNLLSLLWKLTEERNAPDIALRILYTAVSANGGYPTNNLYTGTKIISLNVTQLVSQILIFLILRPQQTSSNTKDMAKDRAKLTRWKLNLCTRYLKISYYLTDKLVNAVWWNNLYSGYHTELVIRCGRFLFYTLEQATHIVTIVLKRDTLGVDPRQTFLCVLCKNWTPLRIASFFIFPDRRTSSSIAI